MSVLLEGALDGELDDSLGYNKYDYKKRILAIVAMGIQIKQCIRAMVIWNLKYLEIAKVNMNHRL